MKKKLLLLVCVVLCAFHSQSQITVAKLLGNNSSKYGLGYGAFVYIDVPLAVENTSLRWEILELAMFPSKGEDFFTTSEDARALFSSRVGYKYVFSETQQGFYILPAIGYCHIMDMSYNERGEDVTIKSGGIAGAMEAGYTLLVGQRSNTLNLGLKYEYDRGRKGQTLQSLGLRFSFGFGMFRR